MEQRRLGNSGLFVSAIGIGCNNFGGRVDQSGTRTVVDAAIDHGVNFFDTADVYGEQQSEVMLGKALGARRSDVIIASKFGMPMGPGRHDKGGSRHYIMRAVEASLERLGTDYIDLYQIHMPDRHTPIDETLDALSGLVAAGKVRYLGHSNFSGWQIADAHWVAQTRGHRAFVTAQNHYSLLEREVANEVLPACERFDLGVLPYFPLASGLLTGKYKADEPPPAGTRFALVERLARRALTEDNFAVLQRLTAYAAAQDRDILSLALCWLLSQPLIASVIAGATSAQQVADNVTSAESWRLTDTEMTEVAGLLSAEQG